MKDKEVERFETAVNSMTSLDFDGQLYVPKQLVLNLLYAFGDRPAHAYKPRMVVEEYE